MLKYILFFSLLSVLFLFVGMEKITNNDIKESIPPFPLTQDGIKLAGKLYCSLGRQWYTIIDHGRVITSYSEKNHGCNNISIYSMVNLGLLSDEKTSYSVKSFSDNGFNIYKKTKNGNQIINSSTIDIRKNINKTNFTIG